MFFSLEPYSRMQFPTAFISLLMPSYLHLQIAELMPLQKKFMDLKAQLELKSYDLKLFEGRAEQNEHHKVCFFFSHMRSMYL